MGADIFGSSIIGDAARLGGLGGYIPYSQNPNDWQNAQAQAQAQYSAAYQNAYQNAQNQQAWQNPPSDEVLIVGPKQIAAPPIKQDPGGVIDAEWID